MLAAIDAAGDESLADEVPAVAAAG
jgi:hypothetical protein